MYVYIYILNIMSTKILQFKRKLIDLELVTYNKCAIRIHEL